MPIVYNAKVSNHPRNAPSATHPYGVGVGWQPSGGGRELTWAGKDAEGRLTFRDHAKGLGVRTHASDDKGVFHFPLASFGDALTLKIDYPNKTWRIDRKVGPDDERPIDPQGLLDNEKGNIAYYVAGMIGRAALEAGPSAKAEIGVAWKDGCYRYTDLRPQSAPDVGTASGSASTSQTGYSPTSQMDPSLPSAAGQISAQAPQGGQSPLGVRLSAADRRAGQLAELDRAALESLGLPSAVETGVLKMADKVARSVDQGSWISLARYADPGHKKTQKDLGVTTPQYIAELLGLHSVGNNLDDGDGITADDMSRLRDLSFTRAERTSPDVVTLFGEARVDVDGEQRTMRAQIDIDISNPGKMRLTGAVG